MGQFRGRADELAVAFTALAAAAGRGEGLVLMVSGEPGAGKTSFLGAVGEQARRRGFAVGAGAADATNAVVPGAPILLALRSGRDPLVDRAGFDQLTPLATQPLLLAENIAELVEHSAHERPVLVLLDDMQWADRLTRFLLRVLSGRLSGAPVVWLVAARPDSTTETDLVESARTLEGVRVSRMELGPLNVADLREIAADILGHAPGEQVSKWLGQIGGNPFLAVQLAEAITREPDRTRDGEQVPSSFSARMNNTMVQLDTDTRRLLQGAAVWGAPITPADLSAFLHQEREDVDRGIQRATTAGILTVDSRVRFRHDLVREIIYESTAEIERLRWHCLAAGYLIDTGRTAIEAAVHAALGIRAGDARSLSILQQAAAQSLFASPATAADLMRQAFEALPVTDPHWSAVGEQYANSLWHAQRGSEAVRVIDLLLTANPTQNDRARLQVLAAHALWLTGQPQNILQRTTVSPPDAVLGIRLDAARALALSRIGTPEEASKVGQDALDRARRLDDHAGETIALHALGEIARNQGQHLLAYERFHELRVSLGANYLPQEITCLQHLDRFDEAETLLTDEADRVGASPDAQLPALASAQLWQHFNRGHFELAESAARSLIRLGNELGNYAHRLDARVALATCAIIHGDLVQARAVVAQGNLERDDRSGLPAPALLLVQARIAEAEGDTAAARILLRSMDAHDTSAHLYWSRSLAQLRLRMGIAVSCADQDLAEQTAERALTAAAKNPGVLSYQGVSLQVVGLMRRDLDMLGEGADILARCPRPSMAGTALADYGSALIDTGRRADGVRYLQQAWTLFDRIGYISAAGKTQQVLHRVGARSPRRRAPGTRPTAGRESLTDAEFRVAELVIAGHTNRSAAQALTVSTNTVSTHLSSVFSKLGVRSRLQLANVWHDRPANP